MNGFESDSIFTVRLLQVIYKMALQDICELNSILNVEDEEKIQLTKQKEKITSAINQQERRVSCPLPEFILFHITLSA